TRSRASATPQEDSSRRRRFPLLDTLPPQVIAAELIFADEVGCQMRIVFDQAMDPDGPVENAPWQGHGANKLYEPASGFLWETPTTLVVALGFDNFEETADHIFYDGTDPTFRAVTLMPVDMFSIDLPFPP